MTPTPEQMQAVRTWAEQYGRRWKAALRDAWMTGNYDGFEDANHLQQLRNQFGPAWLVATKLQDDWKPKFCYSFHYGSSSNPTDVRSGCVGADTSLQAAQMIRAACPLESSDPAISLSVFATKLRWPAIVS